MQKREKQFIIAVVLGTAGFILTLAVGFLYFQKIGTIRYSSKAYGFSLRYPASWSVIENKDGAAAIFLSPLENDLDTFKESVNIVVQDLSAKPMNLKEYSETAILQMKLVFEKNLEILESEPASLSGHPAHKFVFIGYGPNVELQYMIVWTVVGEKAYQVTFAAENPLRYEKFLNQVRTLFNSFRIK